MAYELIQSVIYNIFNISLSNLEICTNGILIKKMSLLYIGMVDNMNVTVMALSKSNGLYAVELLDRGDYTPNTERSVLSNTICSQFQHLTRQRRLLLLFVVQPIKLMTRGVFFSKCWQKYQWLYKVFPKTTLSHSQLVKKRRLVSAPWRLILTHRGNL